MVLKRVKEFPVTLKLMLPDHVLNDSGMALEINKVASIRCTSMWLSSTAGTINHTRAARDFQLKIQHALLAKIRIVA